MRKIELLYLICGLLGVILTLSCKVSYAVFPAIALGLISVFLVRKNVKHKELSSKEVKAKQIVSISSLIIWGASSLLSYFFIDKFKDDGLWFMFSSYIFLVVYSTMYMLIISND